MKSKDFAKIIGITAGHYSDIESGKRTLTPEALGKLGEAVGLDPPVLRQMFCDLAATAEQRQAAMDEVLTMSPVPPGMNFTSLREEADPRRSSFPMISNSPDTAGLARDLVAMMPREDVFKLLRDFTAAGEAGDVHAMRKARALMDLIPMQQEMEAGG